MTSSSWIEPLSTSPQVQALGWTLLQFLWQGTAIALFVALAFLLLHRNPRGRYAVGAVGMLAMLLTFVVTATLALRMPAAVPLFATSSSLEPTSALALWSQDLLPAWMSSATLSSVLLGLTMFWVVGVLVLQLRLLLQWRQVELLRRSAQDIAAPPWNAFLPQLVERLGLRRGVKVLETTALRVPAVIGWLDPVVLVPAGILAHLTPDQLRAVLAHELAHLRRHDHLINAMQCVTETLLFFHPAVWWLSHCIRENREFCCDDVALEACGDTLSYARALQTLEDLRAGDIDTPRNGFGVRQAALASTGGSLMDRITRLFGVQPGSTRRTGRWVVPGALAVLLVTALFAVSCEPNLVQDPPEATNSTSANQFEKAQPQDILVERLPDKDPAQLEAALDKLNMARAAGDLTEEQYQVHVKRLTEGMKGVWKLHSVEPHLEGGDVLLHLDSGDKATFHKVMPQSDEGALNEWIQDIDGAPHLEGQIVWEAADGTKLTKEQLEQEHRKLYFGESPENLTEIHIDKLAPQNETPQ